MQIRFKRSANQSSDDANAVGHVKGIIILGQVHICLLPSIGPNESVDLGRNHNKTSVAKIPGGRRYAGDWCGGGSTRGDPLEGDTADQTKAPRLVNDRESNGACAGIPGEPKGPFNGNPRDSTWEGGHGNDES